MNCMTRSGRKPRVLVGLGRILLSFGRAGRRAEIRATSRNQGDEPKSGGRAEIRGMRRNQGDAPKSGRCADFQPEIARFLPGVDDFLTRFRVPCRAFGFDGFSAF